MVESMGAFIISFENRAKAASLQTTTGNKMSKDLFAVLIGAVGKFRMPLYRPQETCIRETYCFHQAILRISHGLQRGGKFFDCLMMVTVHRENLLSQKYI